jgi:hypothetical protein
MKKSVIYHETKLPHYKCGREILHRRTSTIVIPSEEASGRDGGREEHVVYYTISKDRAGECKGL